MSSYRILEGDLPIPAMAALKLAEVNLLREDWDRVQRDTVRLCALKPEHEHSYLRQRTQAQEELCAKLDALL